MFYQWLLAQRERTDDVGRCALLASQDPQFPKDLQRLYKLLRHYDDRPELRELINAEWRRVRRAA